MAILLKVLEDRGLVTIVFDDLARMRLRKQDYECLRLREGDEADADDIENRVCAMQSADGYEAALCMLDYCARTQREIEQRLLRKGFLPRACESIVERLKGARLIDDAQLAGRITSSASGQRLGAYALKRKLRARGISEEDAEDALSQIDAQTQARAAAEAAGKLLKRYQGLPAREARAKLSQALARRGFAWDTISSTVDALVADDD